MTIKIVALTVSASIFLVGCVAKDNIERKPEKNITVDIINRSPKDSLSAVYFEESYDCLNLKPIVINSTQRNITVMMEKKPYQTVYVKYTGSAFDGVNFHPQSCSATYTFRADESDAYTVILENVFNTCNVEVRRDVLTSSAFLIQKIKLNSRQPADTRPAFSNGPWCAPVEAFKG